MTAANILLFICTFCVLLLQLLLLLLLLLSDEMYKVTQEECERYKLQYTQAHTHEKKKTEERRSICILLVLIFLYLDSTELTVQYPLVINTILFSLVICH